MLESVVNGELRSSLGLDVAAALLPIEGLLSVNWRFLSIDLYPNVEIGSFTEWWKGEFSKLPL